MKVTWEEIESKEGRLWRAKIPGGWLVAWKVYEGGSSLGGGITFYPDPNHKWDGNSLP